MLWQTSGLVKFYRALWGSKKHSVRSKIKAERKGSYVTGLSRLSCLCWLLTAIKHAVDDTVVTFHVPQSLKDCQTFLGKLWWS